ncbi:MAG: hypothetical protein IJU76_06890 [Desulfovibrionaceae bacterium]|nr:hypothetical protein [Desulfovibrionaceae bacterium]
MNTSVKITVDRERKNKALAEVTAGAAKKIFGDPFGELFGELGTRKRQNEQDPRGSIAHVAMGKSRDSACSVLGIAPSTYFRWKSQMRETWDKL